MQVKPCRLANLPILDDTLKTHLSNLRQKIRIRFRGPLSALPKILGPQKYLP